MAWVNENVQSNEKEEDFETLFEESLRKSDDNIYNGVVVAIHDDEIFVDIGKKSEGILSANEFKGENGEISLKESDEIKVVTIAQKGGKIYVSHKKAIRKEKIKEFIDKFDENLDNIIEVKITARNKGGFSAQNTDGVEFFMPKSQSGFKDANAIGKICQVKIIKVNKDEQSIIISRRKLLDEDKKKKKDIIKTIMQEDKPIEGVVKKITTYGMFVDVGGVDGLVHYSEISYKGPVNPKSLFKEGDKILVKVIEYDSEKHHLSLSAKAAMPDPWLEIRNNLDIGDTISVVVSNIEPYGAFVDLGNDIEGFLHISEISWDKDIKNPKDFITEGQEIEVEVIEIDFEQRKLRVSLKNMLPKPFDEFSKNFKVGDAVKGKVTTITKFGAFVKIGLVEGLLHNEDASWDRNIKCQDLFKQDDEIDVKIINIDKKNEKISLSIKELSSSPVENFAKNHAVGDIVNGKISDIKEFGVFVELGNNVDALIRNEDLGNQIDVSKLKIGDDIESTIAFIDEKKNRIRLSVKRLARQKEREVLKEINDNENFNLGDIIKDQLS